MIKKIITAAALSCLVAGTAFASEGALHWGYSGHEGPEYWGDLAEKFATCKAGVNQSPIDITSTIDAELQPITFNYKASGMQIVNNGHTIQINYDKGSTITVEGKTFNLLQFHFHAPSENTIDSKAFAMEGHFVHADDKGNLAVIGVMLNEGAENSSLANIWTIMPDHAGKTVVADGTMNAMDLMPENKDYYRFDGSLTTPPCSEGVTWMVMKNPINVSSEQAHKFAELFHGNNARPVQPINARTILR